MKKLILPAALCAFLLPCAAFADTPPEPSVTGDIGLYTHYVGRGRVQADDKMALQGSLHYNHPISENTDIYAGIWGTNVDFNDGFNARVELDLYTGIAHRIHDMTFKAGFIGYWYPGSSDHYNYDHYEFMGAFGYDFDLFNTEISIKYSPDFFGSSGDATYYHFGVNLPITDEWSASAHLARQEVDNWQKFGFRDYEHWGARIAYQTEAFYNIRFSLDYKNTNISRNACPKRWCDGLFVGGISKSF